MKNFPIKKMSVILAKAAFAIAKNNANTSCFFGWHQPKLPKKVKKLRKL